MLGDFPAPSVFCLTRKLYHLKSSVFDITFCCRLPEQQPCMARLHGFHEVLHQVQLLLPSARTATMHGSAARVPWGIAAGATFAAVSPISNHGSAEPTRWNFYGRSWLLWPSCGLEHGLAASQHRCFTSAPVPSAFVRSIVSFLCAIVSILGAIVSFLPTIVSLLGAIVSFLLTIVGFLRAIVGFLHAIDGFVCTIVGFLRTLMCVAHSVEWCLVIFACLCSN